MVSRDHLTHSKAIQRRTGATFHLATRFLPERARHATYVSYAFFRVADEVVDDSDPDPSANQRRDLELIRRGALGDQSAREELAARGEGTHGADAAPVLTAFDELRHVAGIDEREVNVFIDAMKRDVEATDYADHAELSTYLRGSSVAVANMMLAVMEPEKLEAARPHAKALAEAFQLTNFLRDVREDVVEYDRVYLPRSSLATHGTDTAAVRRLEPTPALRATVQDELRRTEELYRDGVAGIQYLPTDCQPAVLLAAVLYADHHRLIRDREYDVFTTHPSLSIRRRLSLAIRTWILWRLWGDAETVFYRVAPIDRHPAAEDSTNDDGSVGDSSSGPVVGVGPLAAGGNDRDEDGPGHHRRPEPPRESRTGRSIGRLAAVVPWGRD